MNGYNFLHHSKLIAMQQVGKMKINPYPFLMIVVIFSSCLWKPTCQRYDDKDCIRRCGNTNIPYPFGIIGASNCYLNSSFAVICNSSSSPLLKEFNLKILEIESDGNDGAYGTLTVEMPVLVNNCGSNNSNTNVRWSRYNLLNSPFRFPTMDNYSGDVNVFASVGCDGYALFYNESGGIIGGCASVCSLNDSNIVAAIKTKCYGYHCCHLKSRQPFQHYGVMVSTNHNSSTNCRSAFLIAQKYLEAGALLFAPRITTVPVFLRWGDIQPHFVSVKDKWIIIIVIIYLICVVLVIPFITCGICWGWWRFKTRKKRREIKLRAKYFKEKRLEVRTDTTDKTKLFTLSEVRKYTDNFNKDRVLGQGGEATVYKGMLKDGQVVVVKRSRPLDGTHTQWTQFINELILLSQIKHRHVVNILGCCLEDDLPLVVYEYISNGTLSELIHNSVDDSILTWEMRLSIAFQVVTAIDYLHSEFITPIYHRDIKSSNILLDDKYRAKLSGFGISIAISVDQTHLTTCVQGTFGYLDPEYFYSSQYTEKSDVYSFGVILVELLTGQKPIRPLKVDVEVVSDEDEDRSLAEYFVCSMNESTLFDIIDPLILKGGRKEDIIQFANLGKQCLNPTRLERPTMKEVTMVLEGLISCQSSSSMMPIVPNEELNDEGITRSCTITSEIDDDYSLRAVTYDHIDLTKDYHPHCEVEMRLLQTS